MSGAGQEVGEWLGRVVSGYFRYHGVPGNLSSLYRFRDRLKRYWRCSLERRSQTGHLDMNRLIRGGRSLAKMQRGLHDLFYRFLAFTQDVDHFPIALHKLRKHDQWNAFFFEITFSDPS